jgi:hypothetical protein
LIEDLPGALDMEVHEKIVVNGPIGRLPTPLIHNDFKGLEAYLDRHNKYSSWEARLRKIYWETGHYGTDSVRPRLFGNAQEQSRFFKKIVIQTPLEPLIFFIYHYLLKGGFLEGRKGFIACKIKSDHFFHVRAKLYELRSAESRLRVASVIKNS